MEVLDNATQLFDRGVELSHQGNYTEAIQVFDRALAQDPKLADAYGHRCVARQRTGDLQGAIDDCQQAGALYLCQGRDKDYRYAVKMLKMLRE